MELVFFGSERMAKGHETNHARDESIHIECNRWNIVGMNERALCVYV